MSANVVRFPGDAWEAALQRNKQGIVGNEHNCLTIMANDDRWRGVLAYDDFRTEVMARARPPWDGTQRDGEAQSYDAAIPFGESDCVRFVAWMQAQWGMSISPARAWGCIDVVARREHYHPVREYLDSLAWDGVQRLPTWLHDYMGAEQSDYSRFVGISFLLGAVARIYDPGCKVDTAPVFEGPQGIMKSSTLRALFGSQWASDSGVDLASKDRFLDIQGIWVLEFQEFDSFSRADDTRAKAYMSSPCDHYRPPYGRKSVSTPRQCVFFATSNRDDYLKDTTGNRRWWPVACGSIDRDGVIRDRDALWAEAVARYRSGEKWWATAPEIAAQCREMQASRVVADPWQDTIEPWVIARLKRYPEVSMHDVLSECLSLTIDKRGRPEETRVGACLRSIMGPTGGPLLQRIRVRDPQNWQSRRWVYRLAVPTSSEQASLPVPPENEVSR